jgi:hypothetical protein
MLKLQKMTNIKYCNSLTSHLHKIVYVILALICNQAYSQSPDWNVKANDFEQNMTITGIVYLNENTAQTKGVLSAFIDDECRAVDTLTHYNQIDTYVASLIIYGNNDEENKPIKFKFYDIDNDTTYLLANLEMFTANSVTGNFSELYIWDKKISISGIDTIIACDSFKWINGETYFQNTKDVTYTIPNGAADGRDSSVVLNLTINHSSKSIDKRTECSGYEWIDGVKYFANNNTAEFTIKGGAQSGCDSIITLDLEIVKVDTVVLVVENSLVAHAINATYEWIRCDDIDKGVLSNNQIFQLTDAGSYYVKISQHGCMNVSACISHTPINIIDVEQHFDVYPIPSREYITIAVPQFLVGSLFEIYDLTGKSFVYGTLHATNSSLPISFLPNGVYFIKFAEMKNVIVTFLKE